MRKKNTHTHTISTKERPTLRLDCVLPRKDVYRDQEMFYYFYPISVGSDVHFVTLDFGHLKMETLTLTNTISKERFIRCLWVDKSATLVAAYSAH